MFNYFFNRPISSHLSIYLMQISSFFSILHRFSALIVLITLSVIFFCFYMILNFNCINFFYFIFKFYITEYFIFYFTFLFFVFHFLNGLRYIFLFLNLKTKYIFF